MSRVRVRALTPEDLLPGTPLRASIGEEKIPSLRDKLSSLLPSIMVAIPDDNPFSYSMWGFNSRRTSLICSVKYWGGTKEYSEDALMGCVYVAILEGRKRVELLDLGDTPPLDFFIPEGFYPSWEEGTLRGSMYYGFTWQRDEIPRSPETTSFTLPVTPKMLELREKNLKLYDTKLDHQHSDNGETFREEILSIIKELENIPGVTLSPLL